MIMVMITLLLLIPHYSHADHHCHHYVYHHCSNSSNCFSFLFISIPFWTHLHEYIENGGEEAMVKKEGVWGWKGVEHDSNWWCHREEKGREAGVGSHVGSSMNSFSPPPIASCPPSLHLLPQDLSLSGNTSYISPSPSPSPFPNPTSPYMLHVGALNRVLDQQGDDRCQWVKSLWEKQRRRQRETDD